MSKFGDAEVDQVFVIGYVDKSGGIDYQEFVSMMVPNSVATLWKMVARRVAAKEAMVTAMVGSWKEEGVK